MHPRTMENFQETHRAVELINLLLKNVLKSIAYRRFSLFFEAPSVEVKLNSS